MFEFSHNNLLTKETSTRRFYYKTGMIGRGTPALTAVTCAMEVSQRWGTQGYRQIEEFHRGKRLYRASAAGQGQAADAVAVL